ncbi:MAG: flagellar assembly protein FliW [Acidobacteria bacterium]|nr:flagellar assembly protein FliW [Acidobacteriota bacterium]
MSAASALARFPPTAEAAGPAVPNAVTMVDGMPGFERCRHFVVMSSPDLEPLARLQGLDEAGPSFLALDPRVVLPEYEAVLPPADRRRLAADENDSLLWLALVRLEGRRVLVNMRAPVVINPRRMIGLQVVPADSPYSTHHELLLG